MPSQKLFGTSPYITATSLWAVTVAVLPATAIGLLAPRIVEEPGLGKGDIGLLYAAFHLGGASFAFASGRLVDAIGARRSLMLMSAALSAAIVGISTLRGLILMMVACFCCGVAFSVSNPATNKLVRDRTMPGRSFGVALGIKQGGIPFAAVLGGSVLGVAASAFGWRLSYGVLLVGGCALLSLLLVPVPEAAAHDEAATDGDEAGDLRGLLALAAFGLGMGGGLSQVTAYFVLYLVDGPAAVGPVASGYIFSAAGVLGMLARVYWAVVTRPNRQWLTLAAVSAGAMLTSAVIALVTPPTTGVLVLLVVGLGVFVFGWSGAFQVALVHASGSRVGRGSGIAYTGFGLGLTVGPSVFGWLLGTTGGYRVPWMVVTGCFALAVASAVVGWSVSRVGQRARAASKR